MTENQHILDDKITFKEVIQRFSYWIKFFLSQWKLILLAGLIGALLGVLVSYFKKPVFHAETTFVLEETDMSGLGQMSGIASLLGMNLGSVGSSSGLFQGDNIMELYKSDNMLGKALLTPYDEQNLLINRFIAFNKLEEKWENKVDLSSMDFGIARSEFTVSQDSVVKEISKLIREKHLSVIKPDRKLSIIKVNISAKDEAFAKVFNEILVENVNQFYFETKTKKTAENLSILQSQSDSVRSVLDRSIMELASTTDRSPNLNPLIQAATVETKKRQVDVQASTAVYAEIVKNLEMAKVNHRNNSPLIQIIDSPRFPLQRTEIKLSKGIIVGGFVAGLLMVLALYFRQLYLLHLKEA